MIVRIDTDGDEETVYGVEHVTFRHPNWVVLSFPYAQDRLIPITPKHSVSVMPTFTGE